jgi:hypothetical protein
MQMEEIKCALDALELITTQRENRHLRKQLELMDKEVELARESVELQKKLDGFQQQIAVYRQRVQQQSLLLAPYLYADHPQTEMSFSHTFLYLSSDPASAALSPAAPSVRVLQPGCLHCRRDDVHARHTEAGRNHHCEASPHSRLLVISRSLLHSSPVFPGP